MRIKNIKLREVFATNSKKTIEVEIETEKGKVRSSVPVGTSTGKNEVSYILPQEARSRLVFMKNKLLFQDFRTQKEVDDLLHKVDPSHDFKEIGGNLALAVSSSFLKAFALNESEEVFEFLSKGKKLEMPRPICNVIGFKGQRDVEEYLLLPVHQTTFKENIEKITEAYLKISELIKLKDTAFTMTRDLESAWFTRLPIDEILRILMRVSNQYFLKIGMDFAASRMWDGKQYYTYANNNLVVSTEDQLNLIKTLANKFPIMYIEDPFCEDDFNTHAILTRQLSPKLICGDDLLTTSTKRLKDAIDLKAVNAAIVKPNQIGTISDVMEFVKTAKENKIFTVMSHRSGETEDDLICHLAVGLGCEYIKLGISGERTVKINEMLRIEEKLS